MTEHDKFEIWLERKDKSYGKIKVQEKYIKYWNNKNKSVFKGDNT